MKLFLIPILSALEWKEDKKKEVIGQVQHFTTQFSGLDLSVDVHIHQHNAGGKKPVVFPVYRSFKVMKDDIELMVTGNINQLEAALDFYTQNKKWGNDL